MRPYSSRAATTRIKSCSAGLQGTLTVLFGISGLGKTSLLQAGVFPKLREEGFMPVRIQLDHNSSLRHNLVEQVRVELRKELERGSYHACSGQETKGSLWAYFNQTELEMRDREKDGYVDNEETNYEH